MTEENKNNQNKAAESQAHKLKTARYDLKTAKEEAKDNSGLLGKIVRQIIGHDAVDSFDPKVMESERNLKSELKASQSELIYRDDPRASVLPNRATRENGADAADKEKDSNKGSKKHIVLPAFGMDGNPIMSLKDRHELKNIIEERYKAAMDESKLPSDPYKLLAYQINAAKEYKQSMDNVDKVFKGDSEGVELANKLSDQYTKDKPVVNQVGQNNNMDKALSQAMSDPEVVKGLAAASANNSPATSANIPAPVQGQGGEKSR